MYHDQEVSSASYIQNINRCTECAQSIKRHFCVLNKQEICKNGLTIFLWNLILKYVSDPLFNLHVSIHFRQEILENIRVGMNQIEIPPETTNNLRSTPEESQSDDGYSNIYNVLQPNYGAKRHSYPFVVTEYEEKCYTYSYFRRSLSLGMKLPEA